MISKNIRAKTRNGVSPKKNPAAKLMKIQTTVSAMAMPINGLNSLFKNKIGLLVTELINSNLQKKVSDLNPVQNQLTNKD